MKYALIDGEISIHQRDQDTFWPISLDEAQHIVDVMNLHETIKAAGIAPTVPADMIHRAEALLDNENEAA